MTASTGKLTNLNILQAISTPGTTDGLMGEIGLTLPNKRVRFFMTFF